jgi:hypothetical protein
MVDFPIKAKVSTRIADGSDLSVKTIRFTAKDQANKSITDLVISSQVWRVFRFAL